MREGDARRRDREVWQVWRGGGGTSSGRHAQTWRLSGVQNLDCTISFASQEVSWAFERPVVGENR